MKKEIRLARLEDLDEIFQLDKTIFDKPWSKETIKESILSKYSHEILLIDKEKNKLIAFLSYEDIYGDININKIACLKDYRRKGLAGELIKYLFEYGDKNKSNKIMLEVSSKNIESINFYKKFNFKKIYTRDNYYGPDDHALIMERKL